MSRYRLKTLDLESKKVIFDELKKLVIWEFLFIDLMEDAEEREEKIMQSICNLLNSGYRFKIKADVKNNVIYIYDTVKKAAHFSTIWGLTPYYSPSEINKRFFHFEKLLQICEELNNGTKRELHF